MGAIRLSRHDDWPEAAATIVDQGLEDSNTVAAPLHEVRRIACIAQAESGAVVGGALGRCWGGNAELQQLWVSPARRRAGLGAGLVRAFEDLAVARGCARVYLETFSFQAPRLYQALGYVIELERGGFPHDIRKFHMARDLIA